MHKEVLNVKHRIVRRIEIGRAPLATFDSFDLGDEYDKDSLQKRKTFSNPTAHLTEKGDFEKVGDSGRPLCDVVAACPPGTIGGNTSKKALSHTGGEGKEEKPVEQENQSRDLQEPVDNATGEDKKSSPAILGSLNADEISDDKEVKTVEASGEKPYPKSPKKEPRVAVNSEKTISSSSAVAATTSSGLSRQGTIGRVSIPIKKQSSVSSSSSSEACNDSHFTFTASRPSIAHLDSADGSGDLPDSPAGKAKYSSLVPENIDPKQILSPSKRKAYEKRLERLKVTTSPIARPRSNAPINVVTLDEYANLSSPESSPVAHSILQDKLKITLPSDEFAKGSKFSASQRKSEDTCFEFSEEILFRCTKSALVVDEDGHLPISPRRVLIPPTITPTNSPQLSSSPKINPVAPAEVPKAQNAPKLIYMKEDADPTHRFFGLTFDQSENDNWADFTDSAIDIEKADSECSERENIRSNSSPFHQKESSDSLDLSEETVTERQEQSTDNSKQKTVSEGNTADVIFPIHLNSDSKDEGYKTEETSEFLSLTSSSGLENKSVGLSPEHSLCPTELPEERTFPDREESLHLGDESFDVNHFHRVQTVLAPSGCGKTKDNVLVDLPDCAGEVKSLSILEAGQSEVDSRYPACVPLDDPFNLLDSTPETAQDASSVMLPAPFCSSVNTNKDSVSGNIASISLNPFLQYIEPESILQDNATCASNEDTDSCMHKNHKQQLNVQTSSNGHQLLDTNLDAVKSSSSSDLIDFSSSVELELPSVE